MTPRLAMEHLHLCYDAVVTDDVPPGVAVSPKGRWASLSPDRRSVNWLTPDAVAD